MLIIRFGGFAQTLHPTVSAKGEGEEGGRGEKRGREGRGREEREGKEWRVKIN